MYVLINTFCAITNKMQTKSIISGVPFRNKFMNISGFATNRKMFSGSVERFKKLSLSNQ